MKKWTTALLTFFAVLIAVLYIRGRTSLPEEAHVQTTQSSRVGDAWLYPPESTPGAVDAEVTQDNIQETICVTGYTTRVRPPTGFTNRLKRELMEENKLPGEPSDYELDHVIPLELGGCGDCLTNLWMEPLTHPGAHEKDRVENYLHRAVCDGQITLADAQMAVAQDWYSVYLSFAANSLR
jgi:hypothetical protein